MGVIVSGKCTKAGVQTRHDHLFSYSSTELHGTGKLNTTKVRMFDEISVSVVLWSVWYRGLRVELRGAVGVLTRHYLFLV